MRAATSNLTMLIMTLVVSASPSYALILSFEGVIDEYMFHDSQSGTEYSLSMNELISFQINLNLGVDYYLGPSDFLYLDDPTASYLMDYQKMNLFYHYSGGTHFRYYENHHIYDAANEIDYGHWYELRGNYGDVSLGVYAMNENPRDLDNYLSIPDLFVFTETAYTRYNYHASDPSDPNTYEILEQVTGHLTLTDVDYISSPATPIPEPSTILLLTTGLVGMVAYGFRRRSGKS